MVRKTKGAIIGAALFLAIAGATVTVSNFVSEPLTVYAEEQTEYTFGTNVIGTLSGDGKTLTISVKDTLETGRDITKTLSAVLSTEQINNIETVKILDGITSVCNYFAKGDSALKKLILPDNITVGTESFTNSGVTDLTVPENLKYSNADRYSAFGGCELKLKFSKSTTKIGAGVFRESKIKELDFTNSNVTYIGYDCFKSCKQLESLKLKDGMTLAQNCFNDTTSLEYLEIPNVTYAYNDNYGPFMGSGIKKVVFKQGLTEIQPCICRNMTALVNIQIPNTVTKINSCAFMNCTLLKSVTIPDSVEIIGLRAFKGCKSLESVNIPTNAAIVSEAFNDCSKLERISLPTFTFSKFSVYDGIFISSGMKILEIQDGVTNIYAKQFYDNKKLQIIYIPDSVTEIASNAFGLSSTPAFTTKVVTNNEYAKGLDWETLFNRPVEFVSTTIEASDSALGNEGALVSGEISPVTTLDVSIPVSGGSFYIDEKRNVSSRPISVQNNSNAPVSVYLIDTEKSSTEPDLIPIDTYTDTEWANLSEEDTLNYLGMAINGKDIAGTYGNSAKDDAKKIYMCDIGSGYTYADIQNLPIDVKFGKMFTNSEILNMTYNLTFEFTIKQ